MALESIGALPTHIVLSKLSVEDVACVSSSSRNLNHSASDDSLWRNFCRQDLQLTTPLGPHGRLSASFKEAYYQWRTSFSMYPWSLVKRVNRLWAQLKTWSNLNYPELASTYQRGASEATLNNLEDHLKVKLPLPTRVIYRFCDGQDPHHNCDVSGYLGLIGGYGFYDHFVNVDLLSSDQMVVETKEFISALGFAKRSKYIVVASSSTFAEKLFFLNCTNGQLYVGTKNASTEGEMLPCVPKGLLNSVHDPNGSQQQDGLLLWLEEHLRRLQNNIITLLTQKFRCISLFPEELPLCSTAVTNGVKIRASAVLVPEKSDLQSGTDKYLFTYSIRMSLLPEGCIVDGVPYSSCQLYARHWIIKAKERVISQFTGDGVIGLYPILHPGCKEFVYESCSTMPCSVGSIEGFFTFVPGSLEEPHGPPFEVAVAQFPLHLPNYIF
uniref:ApaG domain-containing protein n=1 Tax=Kalanchoe fedtschenkoi TaxID=63787 RepID=A0A7N0TUM6_KALFE